MSYQVNFKLSLHNLQYPETVELANLQPELEQAIRLVLERNSLQMEMKLSKAEVVYLK